MQAVFEHPVEGAGRVVGVEEAGRVANVDARGSGEHGVEVV